VTRREAGLRIDAPRLLARLAQLGAVGADAHGGRTRLALSAEDQAARDLVASWLREAGADVRVDAIGNLYGVLDGAQAGPPIMTGSHIDTVRRAGAYDGCYGVVAGIEVLDALRRRGRPRRAVAVAAFTNEEGVRFAPDLLGSRVVAGHIPLEEALALEADDGARVGDELRRIGYAGTLAPTAFLPAAFVELHIEQGPVLDAEGVAVGVVEAVQGHAWWRIAIEGTANHAGTTPMTLRRDAGAAAMGLAGRLVERARADGVPQVATVGTLSLEPNAINVVPGRAVFTVDLRDPRDAMLERAEALLQEGLRDVERQGFRVAAERISHHAAVTFDPALCALIESGARELQLSSRRMNSGASHDAQMLAARCPTAMIFVPSLRGISHNPKEHTEPAALAQGAELLAHTLLRLVDGGSHGIAGL
jgi:beta-ureidopropionase / N-carbamoyl-L-amino-acid hydrolase